MTSKQPKNPRETMKAIVLRPNEQPEVIQISDELSELQALVGSYIATALVDFAVGLVIYCNDEGLILGLPFNCYRPTDGQPLVGALVAVQVNTDGGQIDMRPDCEERAMALFDQMTALRGAN